MMIIVIVLMGLMSQVSQLILYFLSVPGMDTVTKKK